MPGDNTAGPGVNQSHTTEVVEKNKTNGIR
jgi:hypothetical protein